MKQALNMTFNNAAVATINGKATEINLLDAMSGQAGKVNNITITLEIDTLERPALPYIDVSKLMQNANSNPAVVQGALDTMNKEDGTELQTNLRRQEDMKAAHVRREQDPKPAETNDGLKVITIKKASKIGKMIRLLTLKDGASIETLAKELGMTETGASSYLYHYPKSYGCSITNEVRGKKRIYHLVKPDNVKLVLA